jgi:hypothetical protein
MKLKDIFYPDYETIIKNDYPIIYKFGEVQATVLFKSIKKDQILNEFITQTIPPELTLKNIKSKKEFGDEKIFVKSPTKEELKMLNDFGWYNSSNIGDIYAFEPKYDYEIVPTGNIYHLVPDINLKKVQMMGLTPKTKSKLTKHPERIYFMNPSSDNDYKETAIALWQSLPKDTQKLVHSYYLLEITPNVHKNFKFYVDPNFKMGNGAIWTYKNIPPSHIQVKKKYLVNP